MIDTHALKRQDRFWKHFISAGGVLIILLTLAITVFLAVKGTATFTVYQHSPLEFLFSSQWSLADTETGGGKVGAAIYIYGSLITCMLALVIAVPFSLSTAVFISEISPRVGKRLLQPTIETFVGIPSIIYGWLGLTLLVPWLKELFNLTAGFSVLAAALVLSIMIFPTITALAVDALKSVPHSYRQAAYSLGATRWQVIYQVILPAAKNGLMTAIILGLARAFGEALAVSMVIGKTKSFPTSLLDATVNLTAAIASDMGGTMEGGEYNMALWSMALLLFLLSAFFIFLIHRISGKGAVHHENV